MPIAYVSIAEQKEYSRIQHNALDALIATIIEAASAAVKNYLKDYSPYEGERNSDDDFIRDSNYEPKIFLDSSESQVVKSVVKLAVMYEADIAIKGRERKGQHGYLDEYTVSLLYPLRDPALQ